MNFEIIKFENLEKSLRLIFSSDYKFAPHQIEGCANTVNNFLSELKEGVSIGIEYPYIDRVYRNSYYYYYSSKFKHYHRDCIRLSFFNYPVALDDFFSNDSQNIQDNFLGILVLRPTPNNIIGRNILRPDIFKQILPHYVATTIGHSSINGLKLTVNGFPHSSQDSEMNVCAETALWSILEYFSHRYAEYRQILPREIQKIISEKSNVRQLPSPGLSILDMSYVLKKSGFGVNWYSHEEPEFDNMIKMYVESGIPIMAIVNNFKGTVHVMNIIGRTSFKPKSIPFSSIKKLLSGGDLSDFYEQTAEYLVADDNLPPYKKITLDNPCCNYTDPNFIDCKIVGIIVPLSHKIYIEADKAKVFLIQLLIQFDKITPINSKVLRVFLTSSRSYKHYVTQNGDFTKEIKTTFVNLKMPKFIWVMELSSIEEVANEKASGIMILDATEPKKPEMLAFLINSHYFGTINEKYGVYNIPLPSFKIFNNLNLF